MTNLKHGFMIFHDNYCRLQMQSVRRLTLGERVSAQPKPLLVSSYCLMALILTIMQENSDVLCPVGSPPLRLSGYTR